MRTNQIRKMINEAVNYEKRTSYLASLVKTYLNQIGQRSTNKSVNEIVSFVINYLQMAPDLLDRFEEAAINSNIRNELIPALNLIENYYFEPNDLILDNFGVYGLMDDSYLALTIIQQISMDYQNRMGIPLVNFDLTESNRIIKILLGNTISTTLDTIVLGLLSAPAINNLFNPAFNWGNMGAINFGPDPKIKEQVDLQLGMMGIF